MSVLEVQPGLDQVVFAGDSLQLRCKVSGLESTDNVWWRKGNSRYDHYGDHNDMIVKTTTIDGKIER